MAKSLLLLDTDKPRALQALLEERLPAVFAGEAQFTAQLMSAVSDDPFYDPRSPYARPQFLLDLVSAPGRPLAQLYPALAELLPDAPLKSSSSALVMHERVFVACDPQPYYYHYLMRRRPEFTAADYLEYYSRFHSRMGMHTPAIAGYSQNDIDPAASAALAERLGLHWREVTSISELKLPSVDGFIGHPDVMQVAGPAAADEENFVDRFNSVSFCSQVIVRCGDFETIAEPVFEQHFSQ